MTLLKALGHLVAFCVGFSTEVNIILIALIGLVLVLELNVMSTCILHRDKIWIEPDGLRISLEDVGGWALVLQAFPATEAAAAVVGIDEAVDDVAGPLAEVAAK